MGYYFFPRITEAPGIFTCRSRFDGYSRITQAWINFNPGISCGFLETELNMNENKKDKNEDVPLVLPPLEFSSLVLPFFSQGLILLERIEKEKEEKKSDSLDLAKRLIELLDLLKEKTMGNLQTDEQQFIEASLHQLKMAYMDKANIIKL